MTIGRLLCPIVLLVAAITCPSAAHACMQSAGDVSVFFSTKPAKLPSEIVVLHVQAPADAKEIGGIDVDVLEAADGVRGATKIRVLVEAHVQDCKDYNLGLVGRPAYVLGNYERAGDGSVFFRARWWPSLLPIQRRGKPWQSYVVDPAYLPMPEKK